MKFTFISLLLTAAATMAFAQDAPPIVAAPVQHDVSPDLITMMLAMPKSDASGIPSPSEVVQKHGPLIDNIGSAATPTVSTAPSNTAVQDGTLVKPLFSATAGANFEGLGAGTSGFTVTTAPPDTTMAVGPNHIVQWVNQQFAIYNKSGTPLLPAPGFVLGNNIWLGFGGLCETTNRGDPLVAYDRVADRWIFTQFAFNISGSNATTPYLQCFAVTTGPNPAGPYNRYAYDFSAIGPAGAAEFNDYGKIGVWPDAYYLTYNAFRGAPAGSFAGAIICAYDRAAMIAGSASATELCAPVTFYGGGASLLPADMDGATALPPAGTPNFMMRQGTGAPAGLRLFKFKVNNFSPGSITFNDGFGGATGSFVNIPVTMTRACNGGGATCVPQPGTANLLDTLGDRLMYRLAYRNRLGNESLVVTMAEDPDGAGAQAAAVRWWEIQKPSANPPVLFQNSTFNPTTDNRWMSSIATDKNGNMAMGYSISSGTVSPGIRITGRLRSEVRNQMQAEQTIMNGAGSQTGTLSRWGDYSTMRTDPADDCTFWYTTEYLGADGAFNWQTRIASFKFPNCH